MSDPVVVEQTRELTQGKNANAVRTYRVTGTDDEYAAQDAVLSDLTICPGVLGSWATPPYVLRDEIVVKQEDDSKDAWIVTVSYKPYEYDSPPTGEEVLSFDTGGGTQKITQSLSTTNKYGCSFVWSKWGKVTKYGVGARCKDVDVTPNTFWECAVAHTSGSSTFASDRSAHSTYWTSDTPSRYVPPDFGGAIGVTKDSVEGVDIIVPVFNWSEVHYFSMVDQAYKLGVSALTGQVNQAAFRGFDIGEVLFMGASGERRGNKIYTKWEITFKFAAQKTRSNFSIGDITGITKSGWDYMWIRYEDDHDGAAQALIKRPVGVYIERVYNSGDFSVLNIGS